MGRRGDPVLGKRGSGDTVSTSMIGESLLSQALQWLLVTDVFCFWSFFSFSPFDASSPGQNLTEAQLVRELVGCSVSGLDSLL